MSDVPPGALDQILSRLPVKSLLRFRSVSKSWCSLIDSPYFVNLHLNQPTRTYNVLAFLRGVDLSNSFYSMYLDSGASVVKLDAPFETVGFFQKVLGSCNGLICLSRGGYNREILLWNPSTKKYKLVHTPPVLSAPSSKITIVIDKIGYDQLNKDYKVVRLSQSIGSYSKFLSSNVIVYSLNMNVWQSLEQDFPYYLCEQRGHGVTCGGPMSHGVYICGAIHWVATQNPAPDMNYIIVSFDMDKQSFQLVPQPEYSDKYVAIDLGTLGGCLCVVGNHEGYCVDVWVMEKYGVKESWRKVVALTSSDVRMNALPCIRPIIYRKNGKELLLELDHQWFLRYDLEKKTSKHKKIHDVSYLSTFVYQESLV